MTIFIAVLFSPIVDLFLSSIDLHGPFSIFRLTPLVLTIVYVYNYHGLLWAAIFSSVVFVFLSSPSELAAVFIVVSPLIVFVFRRRLEFLSEQWRTAAVFILVFLVSYGILSAELFINDFGLVYIAPKFFFFLIFFNIIF